MGKAGCCKCSGRFLPKHPCCNVQASVCGESFAIIYLKRHCSLKLLSLLPSFEQRVACASRPFPCSGWLVGPQLMVSPDCRYCVFGRDQSLRVGGKFLWVGSPLSLSSIIQVIFCRCNDSCIRYLCRLSSRGKYDAISVICFHVESRFWIQRVVDWTWVDAFQNTCIMRFMRIFVAIVR